MNKIDVQYHDCPACRGDCVDLSSIDFDPNFGPSSNPCKECGGEGFIPLAPEGIYQLDQHLGVVILGYQIFLAEFNPVTKEWEDRGQVNDVKLMWTIIKRLENGLFIRK